MIGVDVVYIPRLERIAKNEKFFNRVFTKREQKYLERKKFALESIAGLWAAKEAAVKALGTGFTSQISWSDVEIGYRNKKPYIIKPVLMELSISHDKDYAVAIAVVKDRQRSASGLLPRRNPISHKGDYGKLLLLGGSKGMVGSISLASYAALRSGAGLVYTAVPGGIGEAAQQKALEAIILPLGQEKDYLDRSSIDDLNEKQLEFDAVALGPGMGRQEKTKEVVQEIVQRKCPTVIDADGIDHLSGLVLHENCVVTPHEGEFARWQNRGMEEIKKHRQHLAKEVAKKENCIVVLKGHHTVVSDGKSVYINRTGNPGMATAGSGDVLTGIIGAFLARGMKPYDASKLGVYLHGRAGDMAAKKYGEESLIARDIIEALPKAFRKTR